AIGASNFSLRQLEEADDVARERRLTRFCAIQNEYSLLVRDAEHDVLPGCKRLGLGFVPYYPLASGLLTGKYRRDAPGPLGARLSGHAAIASAAEFGTLDRLAQYADERGASLVDVAIGALLAQSQVASVIAGATTAGQVRSNAEAACWVPDERDLRMLDE